MVDSQKFMDIILVLVLASNISFVCFLMIVGNISSSMTVNKID